MAGLTAVLGLLGMFIPPFFLITGIMMPIPLAVLVRRRDLRVAVLSLAVAGLLMMMLYPDPLQVLIMFIQFGPLGLVLGLLYKNYVSSGHALVAASLVSLIAALTVIALSIFVTGLNLELLQTTLNQTVDKVFQFYREVGYPVPAEQQQLLRESMKTAILLLPAAWVIWSVVSTILTYMVGGKVLKRLNYKVNALPPFRNWRLPWYSIWGLILGLSFFMAGTHYELYTLKTIGQNLMMVFGFAFFVVGLAVATYYYKVLPLSKPFKTVMLILMVYYVLFMSMPIVLLGLLDVLFNLRRPLPGKE